METMNTKKFYAKVLDSFKPLAGLEKIKAKDTSDASKVDDLLKNQSEIPVTLSNVIVLSVHNDNAKEGQNKDYVQYLIIDTNGFKYVTGSNSLYESLCDIKCDLEDEGIDISEVEIKIFAKQSKNYSGKYFIKASIS